MQRLILVVPLVLRLAVLNNTAMPRHLTSSTHPTSNWRQLALVGILVIGFYGIIPQLHGFGDSFRSLSHARVRFVWLALLASLATTPLAAYTYCQLAVKSLPYIPTLLVEFASLFVNRLLPAGVGGLGINYQYLRKRRHTIAQAIGVVSINNLLGSLGHLLLLGLVLGLGSSRLQLPHLLPSGRTVALVSLGVIIVAGLLSLGSRWRLKITSFGRHLATSLEHYRERPAAVSRALDSSLLLTLLNVSSLWLCCHALGGLESFPTVFLVFSIGIGLGSATPTPGGLGGVEAGLFAGLVAAQTSAVTALAIVLLYRLLSYWLPLLLGIAGFVVVRRRHYLASPATV